MERRSDSYSNSMAANSKNSTATVWPEPPSSTVKPEHQAGDLESSQQSTTGTSLGALRAIEKGEEDRKNAVRRSNLEDAACANWARAEIAGARASALASKSIFGYCFVAPWTWGYRSGYCLLMLLLSVVVQVVVPLIILWTRQPIKDVGGCPNQSSYQTKLIGFSLSLYFVFQVMSLCINKLRGLGFLDSFVNLGIGRSLFIKLGILLQFAGMTVAGGAQFLLFIGNADGAFVVLVLQSLAMIFCLTVDQNLMGNQNGTWMAARLTAITKDDLLCNGIGIGHEGGPIPTEAMNKIKLLILGEKIILGFICISGSGWVAAVTYCM